MLLHFAFDALPKQSGGLLGAVAREEAIRVKLHSAKICREPVTFLQRPAAMLPDVHFQVDIQHLSLARGH